ncbi:MAG TPA: hypothetical protein VN843_11535 [Anaerolineales bacterium]|nr:hypothetical protein [Anaerolineales bacterium]
MSKDKSYVFITSGKAVKPEEMESLMEVEVIGLNHRKKAGGFQYEVLVESPDGERVLTVPKDTFTKIPGLGSGVLVNDTDVVALEGYKSTSTLPSSVGVGSKVFPSNR